MIDKPIITILLFSDPSLGYNKQKLSFPIDLTKKYPKNGSGLCNQIFRIITSIDTCRANENIVYFDVFTTDINTGDVCPLSCVMDLEQMRIKHGLKVYDIMDFKPQPYYINDDGYVFKTYHQNPNKFSEISKKLIFDQKFEKTSKSVIEECNLKGRKVNLVHLRIDSDYKQHIIGNKDYKHNPSDEYWDNRIKAYDELVDRYRQAIFLNCDKNTPLVLLMEQVDHPLVIELKNHFNVYCFDKEMVKRIFKKENNSEIVGRELFALVDLLIGKNLDSNIFIGLETQKPLCDGGVHNSTFSILLKNIANYKKLIQI